MSRILTVGLAVFLSGVLAAGCAFDKAPAEGAWGAVEPAVELSGQAYARVVRRWDDLPGGPGVDGEPGDFLLENSFVRFVVAAAERPGPAGLPGSLLDAAVQGGEDRLRVLAPAVGVDSLSRPACTGVSVVAEGGVDEAAIVEAVGRLRSSDHIEMTTQYRLEPDTSSLEIRTTVTNTGPEAILGLHMGDIVHHGRTICYAPDRGLMPVGRRTQSKWLAFLSKPLVWGLLSAPLGRIDAVHRQGEMEARYTVDLIPPGESRSYRRYLAAEVGGTARIAQLAGPYLEVERSYLEVVVSDADGEPVGDARALVVPAAGGWPVLLITDEEGRAALALAEGRHSLTVWSPGRIPWGPVDVAAVAGSSHRQKVTLSGAALVQARVLGEIGDYLAPASARVISVRDVREGVPFPAPGPFPVPGASGAVVTRGEAEVEVPLPAARFADVAVGLLTATRGPLFSLGSARLEAEPGETVQAVLKVRRLVDPGDYAAIDCRRHTHTLTDCPLTREEQLHSAAGDGLDAVVLASSQPEPSLPGGPDLYECFPVNSIRIVRDGMGAFSVYPVHDMPHDVRRFLQLTAAEVPAGQLLSRLRGYFPNAVIQVDDPLDGARGYFAASGFDVLKHSDVPDELSTDFDAIELLTGDDVAGARELLAHWFRLLSAGCRVFVTGSSGIRTLDLGTSGATRTFVRCPPVPAGRRRDRVAAALEGLRRRPDAFVTNGPFVELSVNGQPIGGTASVVDGKARLSVRVRAPGWVDVSRVTVYSNGAMLRELPVSPAQETTRLDQTFEVPVPSDSWFVVVVEGDEPMVLPYRTVSGAPTPFAVTNPVWVDADGDGRVGPVPPLGK
jgi:hypothetical protein